MKADIYTIEYGYRYNPFNVEDFNDYEYYCTNEISFKDKDKYEQALTEILLSTINNESQKGYYIECYLDKDYELTDEDIFCLENEKTLTDAPPKMEMIKEFIIFNTTQKENEENE